MITVQAPSRLHFGLISLAPEARWPNSEGACVVAGRVFGSVGLMVQEPGLRVHVEPAQTWWAEGPLAQRALDYSLRLRGKSNVPGLSIPILPPHKIVVEQAPREHVGLGTGTQLALAVARALAPEMGWDQETVAGLAQMMGRGRRSALGIHGFIRGGFLVDGGIPPKGAGVAPLLTRCVFPASWRIILVIPAGVQGLHGEQEQEGFADLRTCSAPLATTDTLCRLVLLGMLPALLEQDVAAFGEALYDFNRRVGEIFAPVQGGPYSHPIVADLVAFIRQQGVAGVGQSSWGPTVFAVVADADEAKRLATTIRDRFAFGPDEVICTTACPQGATVTGKPRG
jgi:beta-RFAP synthase